MRAVDFRLNAIVDASLADLGSLPDLASLAARAGATIIQYRDKFASTRAMIENAAAMRLALENTGVPLVINDRVDVALAAQADGVHLGADDMEPEMARQLLGPDAIIGLTVKKGQDAARAGQAPVNYACIGGVFETLSKKNPDPPVGLEGLVELREQIRTAKPQMPVGAIAGITLDRIAPVLAAGADGIAAISALFRVSDPAGEIAKFRKLIDQCVQERQI